MLKRNSSFWILIAVLTYVVGHSFVALFMAQETAIYQWDLVIFWKKWLYYVTQAPSEPLEAVKVFVRQLRYTSYGDIPSILCAPVGWALDASRTSYIHSIAAVLAIPALFCGLLPISHYFKLRDQAMKSTLAILAWLSFALFLPIWRPVIRGNVGAGAVAVAFIVLYLWFKKPLKEQTLKTLLIIGLLLALLPLYRRWMAFWVVAFFVSVGLFDILPLLWKENLGAAIKQGLRVSIAGVTAVGVMLFIAYPALQSMWLLDYQDVYAGYKHSRGVGRIFELWRWHFGGFCMLAAIWGLISGLLSSGTRKWTGFLGVHLALSFFLFARTQDFAEHHYYLIVPTIALLMTQGLVDLALRISGSMKQSIYVFLVGLFMTLQFAFTFFPQAYDPLRLAEPVFAKWVAYPFTRGDLDEMADLLDGLSAQIIEQPEAKIYTLASSKVLSDNLLRDAHLVLTRDRDIRDNILSVGHLDRLDLFPHALISADLVVVCDPPQIHLVEEEQEIVTLPNQQFLEARGIATHFELLPERYLLDNGTTAMIFKRTSTVSEESIATLEKELGTLYIVPEKAE